MAQASSFTGRSRHPRPLRLLLVAASTLVLTAIQGCGSDEEAGQKLGRRTVESLEDVPPELMAVAKSRLPGVTFEEAWTNVTEDGQIHSYEIRGRNAEGRIREVRIGRNGQILEME